MFKSVTCINKGNTIKKEGVNNMEVIKKGEKAQHTGIILNRGEHEAYTAYIKLLPKFKQYLDEQERRQYDNWDW